MPPGRSNRGGRRKPQQSTNYTNRSDLQTRQPPRAATGQTYGQAGAQLQAQQAIPLPGGGATAGAMAPGSSGAVAQGGQMALSLGAGPGPGELGPLYAPTDRPGEPLTHGLPTGPGAGPEALTPPNPLVSAAAVLNMLGDTADADTKALRAKVNAQLGNTGAA